MFRKRQLVDPAEKAADREELDRVKDRLTVVERRVRILTYQLQIMRRDKPNGGMVA